MTTAPQAQIGGGVWNFDPNHSLGALRCHFDIAYVKDVSNRSRARSRSTAGLLRRSQVTIDASSSIRGGQMRET
jgi:hypothetical protein